VSESRPREPPKHGEPWDPVSKKSGAKKLKLWLKILSFERNGSRKGTGS